MPLSVVEDAIEDIRAGKMVVIVDDEYRENEGDLAMAASKFTPDALTFSARFGGGRGGAVGVFRLAGGTMDSFFKPDTATWYGENRFKSGGS